MPQVVNFLSQYSHLEVDFAAFGGGGSSSGILIAAFS